MSSNRKVISRCRGWSYAGSASSRGGVEVNVSDVCACKQHKKCASSKRCELLFADGGTYGADGTLAALMKEAGRVMPRSWNANTWRHYLSQRTYTIKREAMEGFERKFFNQCKPVIVEVRRR